MIPDKYAYIWANVTLDDPYEGTILSRLIYFYGNR